MKGVGEDVKELKCSYIARENVKNCSSPLEKFVSVPKLYRKFTYDPIILLLGIYPREFKTYVHTKMCASVVALFLIAKKWGKPKVYQLRHV